MMSEIQLPECYSGDQMDDDWLMKVARNAAEFKLCVEALLDVLPVDNGLQQLWGWLVVWHAESWGTLFVLLQIQGGTPRLGLVV